MTAGATTPAALKGLLVVLCAALGLVVAGNSALAIALPDIAADLGADQSELTWIVDCYALTFAALLLTAGILADRIGRRTLLMVGLLVFGVTNLVSALVSEPSWFIALRAASGVGAAAIFPVTLSALVDAYPEDRRTFAVGVWSGVSSAGAVLGTLVAGGLLEIYGWASVQVLFGATTLLLLPAVPGLVAQNRTPGLPLDPLGAWWSTVALTGVVFGIIEGAQRGWGEPATLTALGVGVVGLALFVRHELHSPAPSLDVRLFRHRGLLAGSLIVTVQFFASLALFVLAPQYLQLVEGLSPLEAAATLLVIPVGVSVGIGVATLLVTRSGARLVGAGGLVVMGVGLGVLSAGLSVGTDGSTVVLVCGLVLFGVGFGAGIAPGTILILEGLPAQRRSVASAVNDITREVGGVLGIAALSGVLISSYRDDIRATLDDVPPGARDAVESGAGAALGVADTLGPAGVGLSDAVAEAFVRGLSDALWVGAVLLLVTGVVVALLSPGGRQGSQEVPAVEPTQEPVL